jgi:hypothetical protein
MLFTRYRRNDKREHEGREERQKERGDGGRSTAVIVLVARAGTDVFGNEQDFSVQIHPSVPGRRFSKAKEGQKRKRTNWRN